jgi:hypothetical protein
MHACAPSAQCWVPAAVALLVGGVGEAVPCGVCPQPPLTEPSAYPAASCEPEGDSAS